MVLWESYVIEGRGERAKRREIAPTTADLR